MLHPGLLRIMSAHTPVLHHPSIHLLIYLFIYFKSIKAFISLFWGFFCSGFFESCCMFPQACQDQFFIKNIRKCGRRQDNNWKNRQQNSQKPEKQSAQQKAQQQQTLCKTKYNCESILSVNWRCAWECAGYVIRE